MAEGSGDLESGELEVRNVHELGVTEEAAEDGSSGADITGWQRPGARGGPEA